LQTDANEFGGLADAHRLPGASCSFNPSRRHGYAIDVSPVQFGQQYFNRLESAY
jgi:hypothetical protein